MEKKYQIFISSTFSDLVEERQAVSRAILDMGHIPAGMEMFPASDTEQLSYIEKVIDECDYYVLIIGARYGSIDAEGVSYTEREFEYAVNTGKTVLAFMHRNIDEIPLGKTDKNDEKLRKLREFIEKISSGRLVQFWESPSDLRANAIVSLTKAFSDTPQVGWVRANMASSAETMADVIRYRKENDELLSSLRNLQAATNPKFENAADLDTTMLIRYTYTTQASGMKHDAQIKISFNTFLRYLGESLFTPTTVELLTYAVKNMLKERYGKSHYSSSIRESDLADILMHLVATNHVKTWASTVKTGQHVVAYQLTELGVRTWQEMSYVQKGDDIPTN